MPFHPATLILIWLGFAIAAPALGLAQLALVSLPLLALPLRARDAGAWRMLRRARWLLLSLLLVYAFATPGDPALPILGAYSPTLQGLAGGALQAWRLALLLLALSLLLRACPREALLDGLYTLLRPFRALGLDPERVAVRLWLTLHYAEHQAMPRIRALPDIQAWLHALDAAPADGGTASIMLPRAALSWRDPAAWTTTLLLAGIAWW